MDGSNRGIGQQPLVRQVPDGTPTPPESGRSSSMSRGDGGENRFTLLHPTRPPLRPLVDQRRRHPTESSNLMPQGDGSVVPQGRMAERIEAQDPVSAVGSGSGTSTRNRAWCESVHAPPSWPLIGQPAVDRGRAHRDPAKQPRGRSTRARRRGAGSPPGPQASAPAAYLPEPAGPPKHVINAPMILGRYRSPRRTILDHLQLQPLTQTRTCVVPVPAASSTSSSRIADFLARSARAYAWALAFVTAARPLIVRPINTA